MLKILNQQIGFYRNTSLACIVALIVVVAYSISGHDDLSLSWWLPLLGLSAVVFVARYRRFRHRFGDYVIRGSRLL